MKYFVSLSVFFVITTAQMPLPKYIKPCKRNDPNLNVCFAESANRAMVQMLQGDPEYDIPSLLPFKYKDVDFIAPGLKLVLMNINIHGVEHMKVVDPHIDLDKKLIKFYFTNPMITWEGDYLADVDTPTGTVQKDGHVNLNFGMGKYLMTYQFILEERNGTSYAKIILAREEFLYVNFNIEASKGPNDLSDEEWEYMREYILNEDFLLICARAVQSFIDKIFDVVPYDLVFPL